MEQQAIIKHQGKNLLVSAAAGSGKTRVLVERILDLIINHGCSLDRMLVATFTNAAAGEMRSRISGRLNQFVEISLEQNQGTLARHLIKEINQVNQAQISTLHSFCMEVVRAHFYVLGIEPAFRVADSGESEILKNEAMDEMLEARSSSDASALLALLDMFSGPFNDQGLRDEITRLFNFIMSRPDPWQWLDASIQALLVDASSLTQSSWCVHLMQQVRLELGEALTHMDKAVHCCAGQAGMERIHSFLSTERDNIQDLAREANNDTLYWMLLGFSFSRRPAAPKQAGEDVVRELGNAREQAKTRVVNAQSLLVNRDFDNQAREYAVMHEHLQFLKLLVQDYARIYGQKKQERGLLDFTDLEHMALAILQNPEIAAIYRQRFEHVFIDEYQDTSPIQEALLDGVSRSGNVFMVGDVKQSIYRFRLADPAIFMGKYRRYSDDQASDGCLMALGKNYRSAGGIIGAVNYVFGQVMTAENGEIDYSEGKLEPGLTGTVCSGGEGAEVELLLLDNSDENSHANGGTGYDAGQEEELQDKGAAEDSGLILEEMQMLEKEAWLLAGRIQRLIADDEIIRDAGTGEMRPVAYRDITVLLRATSRVADIFSGVFVQAGIPVYCEAGAGYFDSLEIQLVLNLLRLIDNKRQDIPLVSVMHSPFFGFELKELADIRIFSRQQSLDDNSFIAAVEQYAEKGTGPLRERVSVMLALLQQWKEEARFLPLDELIWKLLIESGFYYYSAALPGGRQRTANLDLLLEKARVFQAGSLQGLFNFIGFIDGLQSGGQDAGAASIIGENDNVVRIMSIHKSKGLEFPVVCVAGLGRRFNMRDSTRRLLVHGEMGLGPYYIDLEQRSLFDTLARKAIISKLRQQSLAEEMRILYVAMTRAESRLILSGSLASLEKNLARWTRDICSASIGEAGCFLDWLGPVLLRHEKDGGQLRERAGLGKEFGPLLTDDSVWSILLHNQLDVIKQPVFRTREDSTIAARQEETGQLRRLEKVIESLNWRYQYPDAVGIPSKLSVTAVKRFRSIQEVPQAALNEMAQPLVFNRPRFAGDTSGWSEAETGTLYHLVLQNLDLAKVSTAPELAGQLENMITRELLGPEEAAAVNTDKLLAFFQSGLGQRMLCSPLVKREVAFNLKIKAGELLDRSYEQEEDLLLQGVIDLFFEEEGQLVLVDYKSGYSGWDPSDAVEAYGLQINLYRKALESIYGKKVKSAYLYMLNSGQEIELASKW